MRNLVRLRQDERNFNANEKLQAMTWDLSSKSVYCLFHQSSEAESGFDTVLKKWHDDLSFSTVRKMEDVDGSQVIRICFSNEPEACYALFDSGNIVLVNDQKMVVIGSIEGGISSAEMSPDCSILAIISKTKQVILMTQDFETLSDVRMDVEDLQASKQVSVGWGKAETQFKGKSAKAGLRDPTVPEKIDEGTLSSFDQDETVITWRDDSEWFCVSSKDVGRRSIRVYDRHGVLHSVSEPCNGLHSQVAWSSSSRNLIAALQQTSVGWNVIFFELNGLRHGEFDARIPCTERITQLKWNSDSTILSIVGENGTRLWTSSNYHWSLKQHITSSSAPEKMEWHPEDPMKLVIHSQLGASNLSLGSILIRGTTKEPHDIGAMCVIDGQKARLTPLSLCNIPPPMSLLVLDSVENLSHSAFDPKSNHVAIITEQSLSIRFWDVDSNTTQLKEIARALIPHKDARWTQVAFAAKGLVACIELEADAVFIRSISFRDTGKCIIGNRHKLSQPIRLIGSLPHSDKIWIEYWDGRIISYDTDTNDGVHIDASTTCQLTDAKPLCSEVEAQERESTTIAFSLARSGKLFANNVPIATSIISFATTNDYLFTTSQSKLGMVPLNVVAGILHDATTPKSPTDVIHNVRNLEKGSEIITVIPSKQAIVMQLPRGNLETLYPRVLILDAAHKLITLDKHHDAFYLALKHRLDLNILYDYGPDKFVNNVHAFVDRLSEQDLAIFLASLKEKNVEQTLYKLPWDSTNSAVPNNAATNTPSKVNSICNLVIKALSRPGLSMVKNNSKLTAFVMKNPPDYEGALNLLVAIQDTDNNACELAVQHLCYLADTNTLYDFSLGMYNLRLALLIAQQSQKDPKEYLPFLQQIQNMDSSRQKFTIDTYLKRHASALSNLCKADGVHFHEIEDFITTHRLYTHALRLFCDSTHEKELKRIFCIYAERLQVLGDWESAALAWENANEPENAAHCYQNSGMWEQALSIAMITPSMRNDISGFAETLIAKTLEESRHDAAGKMYCDFFHDWEKAVVQYCKALNFNTAIYTANLHGMERLVNTVVKPELVIAYSSSTHQVSQCREQWEAQSTRLAEVKAKKMEDPQGPENADIPDNVSIAPSEISTSGSMFTRYSTTSGSTSNTNKSSRNRRKEERKRARGKPGSVWEEEYLTNSLHRLVEKINDSHSTQRAVIDGLVRTEAFLKAVELQKSICDLIGLVKQGVQNTFGSPSEQEMSVIAKTIPIVKDFNVIRILETI